MNFREHKFTLIGCIIIFFVSIYFLYFFSIRSIGSNIIPFPFIDQTPEQIEFNKKYNDPDSSDASVTYENSFVVKYSPDNSKTGLYFVSPKGHRISVDPFMEYFADFSDAFFGGRKVYDRYITSFYIPQKKDGSSEDKPTLIFSASAWYSERFEQPFKIVHHPVNMLFEYNTVSDKVKVLYKEDMIGTNTSPKSSVGGRILRLVGEVGTYYILMEDAPGHVPGPCFDIWHQYPNRFYKLRKTGAGSLEPYRVSKAQLSKAEFGDKACMREGWYFYK